MLVAGIVAWGAAVFALAHLRAVAEDYRRAAWTQYEWFGFTNRFAATREVNAGHYLSAFGLVVGGVAIGAFHVSSALVRLG
ncbi:hypothetical protein C1280_35570 [Gemmata obscuriglobus]|uniref:Uncharacterized protein n=1 Tax=Gemmata obscuriglobus TaxID=114 RepID=A0A2Z3HIY8_9BACT|nr:hypothetical protein C1280_35570 [Gemmata obscuriglobus]